MEERKKILVIDDDQVTRHLLKVVLEKHGFEVVTANNGKEGLQVFKKQGADVICLDIQMPVMDGYEFVAQFKKKHELKETPLIILSSYETKQDVFKCEGINDYIVKPFKTIQLINKIRTRLAKKTKKILVVDDEPDFVDILSLRLVKSGYDVITAYDGLQALERAKHENPDLMLLDVMMPKVDGFNVCRMIKFDNRYRNINIVLLTARSGTENRLLGKQVGADAYLTKPYDNISLFETMKELLWD